MIITGEICKLIDMAPVSAIIVRTGQKIKIVGYEHYCGGTVAKVCIEGQKRIRRVLDSDIERLRRSGEL